MTPGLLRAVQLAVRRHGLFDVADRVVVGVSGGPDSLCLLHLLRFGMVEHNLHLQVAHLHHGMRGIDADSDAAFVRQIAEAWELPYIIHHADVPAMAARPGVSLEEAARQARYAFLATAAQRSAANLIAVGHNADDQTETVLMHWLRGSGLAGLRGMLPVTPLDTLRLPLVSDEDRPDTTGLKLVRPLLGVSRDQILDYCDAHDLSPRFDCTNLDTTLYRNRLRHELLPLLETYNPQIRVILRRSAAVIADDFATVLSVTDDAWKRCVLMDNPRGVELDLDTWRNFSLGLQRTILRRAVRRLRSSLRDVSFEHIEHAVWLAREGSAGTQATLPDGLMLTVDYDRLRLADSSAPHLMHDLPQLHIDALALAAPGTVALPDSAWAVTIEVLTRAQLPLGWDMHVDRWHAYLDADAVGREPHLRRRRPGDRFQPLGMHGHSVELSNFMTNAKLDRSMRGKWPLLIGSEGIAWVVGLREDERCRITADTRRVLSVRFTQAGGASQQ